MANPAPPVIEQPPRPAPGEAPLPTLAELDALGPNYPVGLPEIASAIEVNRQTVDQWRIRNQFPPEAGPFRIGGRPWWLWGEVRQWAVDTNRLESEDAEPVAPKLAKGEKGVKLPLPRHRSQ